MSSHGLFESLIFIPIPVIAVAAAGLIKIIATSGTSLDPRPRWRKWLAYALIIWGAGLTCGLYTDAASALHNGWPNDWLTGFTGTMAFLILATTVMPIIVILWGIGQLLKKLFPNLRLGGSDDWDITSGL